jgi:predicted esterase
MGEDEDEEGILATAISINHLIQFEIADGIAPHRIILGGFSQGGVATLFAALTTEHHIGGVFCLSGWLALGAKIHTVSACFIYCTFSTWDVYCIRYLFLADHIANPVQPHNPLLGIVPGDDR